MSDGLNDALSDAFLGAWDLVPELCLYEAGEPPARGRYTIARDGARVAIAIVWEDRAGQSYSVAYAAPADGAPIPYEGPGADAMSLTRIDAHTLDSAAFKDGVQISYARRSVAHAGDLLVNVQEARLPDGRRVRNFQTYRRAP